MKKVTLKNKTFDKEKLINRLGFECEDEVEVLNARGEADKLINN